MNVNGIYMNIMSTFEYGIQPVKLNYGLIVNCPSSTTI